MVNSGLSGEMGTGVDLVDSRRMDSRSRARMGRGRDLRDMEGVGVLILFWVWRGGRIGI